MAVDPARSPSSNRGWPAAEQAFGPAGAGHRQARRPVTFDYRPAARPRPRAGTCSRGGSSAAAAAGTSSGTTPTGTRRGRSGSRPHRRRRRPDGRPTRRLRDPGAMSTPPRSSPVRPRSTRAPGPAVVPASREGAGYGLRRRARTVTELGDGLGPRHARRRPTPRRLAGEVLAHGRADVVVEEPRAHARAGRARPSRPWRRAP